MGIKESFTFIKLPLAKQICLAKNVFRLQFCCHNAGQDKGKKKKKKRTHTVFIHTGTEKRKEKLYRKQKTAMD